MATYETDAVGYPLDPQMRQLQAYLGTLAGMWRNAKRKGKVERQAEIVQEYHETMAQLYALGWDDALDIDAELPDEFLPEEYLRRTQQRRDEP
ncbi:MAG: hypothetical protein HC884_19795 [Chloroflexaceae bacterium]|nr:hypothetical protein [Chloroflexaceae bacterium]